MSKEKVKQVDRDANKGAAVKAAKRQNESLTPSGRKIVNVITNSGLSVLTHDAGNE
jgi:hypothetical protein